MEERNEVEEVINDRLRPVARSHRPHILLLVASALGHPTSTFLTGVRLLSIHSSLVQQLSWGLSKFSMPGFGRYIILVSSRDRPRAQRHLNDSAIPGEAS
jgi:hypothetical protein